MISSKPASAEDKRCGKEGEDQLWEVTRKGTMNKGMVVMQISVTGSIDKEFLGVESHPSFPLNREEDTFTNGDFPHTCKCFLGGANFANPRSASMAY